MYATQLTLAFCCVVTICDCTNTHPENASNSLTPTAAKSALLTLVTDSADAFEFSPDPEMLAAIDVESTIDGKYQFGAFTIDPITLWYSASIEWQGGMHEYSGEFMFVDGRWIASPPETIRFHNPH